MLMNSRQPENVFPERKTSRDSIFLEGKNCWRIARANRVSFLIDSASYFAAFADAAARATRSLYIVGWEIDSRIELVRGGSPRPYPTRLGKFLKWLVQEKPALHIHILHWDFSLVFALEREFFPLHRFRFPDKRFHYRFDGHHPFAGSHHQKIVVIDDKVAFAGGIDIAKRRWDRPSHFADDELRTDVNGKLYPPTHDVQMAVAGPAAAALGDLVRERWKRLTGRTKPPDQVSGDPWPPGLKPDIEDVDVAISRTQPKHGHQPEVREVERLYLDAIAAARRFIYIENQYFTSSIVEQALAKRLQEKNGPEIVLVLPQRSEGWLSKSTMDICRGRTLRNLQKKDCHGRLRLFYPTVPGLGDKFVEVHAKVLVVDDTFVRIGSSNLNNRSMAIDTECDLSIEAIDDERIKKAITNFFDQLLGQHLDVPSGLLTLTIDTEKSLITAIEKLGGTEHTLVPLEAQVPEFFDGLMPDNSIIDPIRPIVPERLFETIIPRTDMKSGFVNLLAGFLILLTLAGTVGAWRWTALGEWIDFGDIFESARVLGRHDLTPLLIFACYMVGGLIFFPVTLMIVATAVIFEPAFAFFYSLLGCLLSAAATFAIGRTLGRPLILKVGGPNVHRLSRRLDGSGIFGIFIVRIFPVAPYTGINVVAGASKIGFGGFMLGTLIGMTPGIFIITAFGWGIKIVAREPVPEGFLFLTAYVTFIASVLFILGRFLMRYSAGGEGPRTSDKN